MSARNGLIGLKKRWNGKRKFKEWLCKEDAGAIAYCAVMSVVIIAALAIIAWVDMNAFFSIIGALAAIGLLLFIVTKIVKMAHEKCKRD